VLASDSLRSKPLLCGLLTLLACVVLQPAIAADPLSDWNDGAVKSSIIEFVAQVVTPDSADFLPRAERVAVFDNDGTLWAEEPWPVPFEFVFWRIRSMAANTPGWRSTQPFQAVIENDRDWLQENTMPALRKLLPIAQADLSIEGYDALVKLFLRSARHPETGLRYTEMVYQPMLLLLGYLRAHDFEIYVVSGGDVDFIRAYSEQVYGIPKSNVVGTRVKYKVAGDSASMHVVREEETDSVNVGGNKVINIHLQAGRRPVIAVGNSDGDLKMLQYAEAGAGISLGMVITHDDPEREFSAPFSAARLRDEADKYGWLQVSMKDDFSVIYMPDAEASLEGAAD
jgi:hypothetical protein